MEPDRDGADAREGRATPEPVSSRKEGALGSTNSPPAATESDNKGSEHDSLVTVRLSEPPSLHLNTAVPPSTIPTRKTPLPGQEPNNPLAETLGDDDDDDDSESEIFEPDTSASRRRPNLLQELGRASPANTDEEGEGRKNRDSCSSSGSDRVDWEELQKKEELESRSQGSNNVRVWQRYLSPPSFLPRVTDSPCHRLRPHY
jgi:hypothetical protein